jgi:hypothetical protein
MQSAFILNSVPEDHIGTPSASFCLSKLPNGIQTSRTLWSRLHKLSVNKNGDRSHGMNCFGPIKNTSAQADLPLCVKGMLFSSCGHRVGVFSLQQCQISSLLFSGAFGVQLLHPLITRSGGKGNQ